MRSPTASPLRSRRAYWRHALFALALLAPLGARVTAMPFTPERILKALGKV